MMHDTRVYIHVHLNDSTCHFQCLGRRMALSAIRIGAPNAGATLNSCARAMAWESAVALLQQLYQWQVPVSNVCLGVIYSRTCLT